MPHSQPGSEKKHKGRWKREQNDPSVGSCWEMGLREKPKADSSNPWGARNFPYFIYCYF